MGRTGLIAIFVLLVAADIFGVTEVVRLLFTNRHQDFAFWGVFVLVALFNAGLIWLTVRVWRRLQMSSSS
jgi:hypothetical protein